MKYLELKKKLEATILVAIVVMLFVSCSTNLQQTDRITFNFNQDWKFAKQDSTKDLSYSSKTDNSNWKDVSLPHSATTEPLVITDQQWQGVCWYKKEFKIAPKYKGKHIALYFEGAMHTAEIWLNGEKLKTHKGGYLPFYVELLDKVNFDKVNNIAIKLDNQDNPQVPPGKPIDGLDFNYYSGIYRNVHLVIKDNIHITNSIQTNIVAGGGVFVETIKANSDVASIRIRTDILNDSKADETLKVQNLVYDALGDLVSSVISESKEVTHSNIGTFITEIKIDTPNLWSPEYPQLYTVKVKLLKDDIVIDSDKTIFGVRTIQFNEKGFYLNGKKYSLRGTNRHQEYPYIGYALSDNAQYRDVYKIKEAGFNFVRLSHYPHAKSFMNACDELGILVMDAIPGWQFFGDTVFQEKCYDDIRQLIRRDRNHPSIILWEASLNESDMTESFMEKAHAIVHEELPEEQIYTCGWMDYAYDVFIPARQHAKAPDYWKKYDKDRPLFIAEYGDWEYYAQNAGFDQAAYEGLKEEERTSRQLRGDGQKRLVQQALNYQEAHNDNLYNAAAGDANWLMFDYNRGYAPDIESSGIMDIFRLPKFAYYFYSSQKELDKENPVLFIANYWNDPTYTNVKVYSNCDEVGLWLNGTLIEKRQPDTDKYSTNLSHPPFTFKNITYQKGTLTVKGYANGKLISETTRNTPSTPAKISLSIDTSNKPIQADGNDVIFVYATITDAQRNYVPTATTTVDFKVQGNAQLIGDNPAVSEAGVATILLKIGKTKGKILVSAFSENLQTGSIELDIEN